MSRSLPITAVVLTLNEEKNIERCLNSLHFVDEVLVLDSGSTDATTAIAAKFSNVQVITLEWQGFSETKNVGIERARNEYILWIDADEEIGNGLETEIRAFVTMQSGDVGIFPRRTFFIDRFVKYCGWYPDYQKRLFKKTRAKFNNNIVHEDLAIAEGSKVIRFRKDLNHYSFFSLQQYFAKQHKYGFLAADELKRRGKAISLFKVIFNPWWAFMHTYFVKAGFLEGYYGLVIAVGSAYGKFLKYSIAYRSKS